MGLADLLKFKRPEILRLAQKSAMRHTWDNQNDEVWNGVWMSGLKEERSHEN